MSRNSSPRLSVVLVLSGIVVGLGWDRLTVSSVPLRRRRGIVEERRGRAGCRRAGEGKRRAGLSGARQALRGTL